MKQSTRQAKNAIKWIDELINGNRKQGKSALGNAEIGFCCLGVGCDVLNVEYNPEDGTSAELEFEVGLRDDEGRLFGAEFYNESFLININDNTTAGFKRIGKFMLKHPEAVFLPEVAKKIKEIS